MRGLQHALLAVALLGSGLWSRDRLAFAEEGADWRAGAAKVAITPERPMWMSGYASRNKPATGTLHELWAKALVLEDAAGHRSVLVTLDLVGIDRETSRAILTELHELFGLGDDQVAICTSHTHTGPVVGNNLRTMYFLDDEQSARVADYTALLRKRVVEVVRRAMGRLEPASLTHGLGRATFAVNRRNNREADVPEIRARGALVGPVDHRVPVLAVRDGEGNLVALVTGYACHATVLSSYEWSGDWPGFAQIEIEKRHPGTIALFWAGCGADQNPLPRRRVELAEKYGRELADAVDRVLADPDGTTPVASRLRTRRSVIDLPFGTMPTREDLERDRSSDNRYVASRAMRLLKVWERNGRLETTYPYPVQVWRLGEVTFVVLGGEVVVDYANRLSEEIAGPTWVAGYANDVMAYIPSRRVLREGGYEGATSMVYYGLPTVWHVDVERRLVDEVHRLVKTLDSDRTVR